MRPPVASAQRIANGMAGEWEKNAAREFTGKCVRCENEEIYWDRFVNDIGRFVRAAMQMPYLYAVECTTQNL